MGQYHKAVNLDKKEYLDNYLLGCGAKLLEQHGEGSVASALHLLLSASSGRGGGDYMEGRGNPARFVGRWSGDRIAIIGDYAETEDVPGEDAPGIYRQLGEAGSDYVDITLGLAAVMEEEFELVYIGDGWKDAVPLRGVFKGYESSHLNVEHGARQLQIAGKCYLVRDVRAALSKATQEDIAEKRTPEHYGISPAE